MNATRLPTLCAALTLAAGSVTGCAVPASPTTTDTQEASEATTPSGGSALAIEEAERALDVGKGTPAARASLEAVIADPATTPEQRDQARLALSRALEASDDREGATKVVEALLADHPAGARYPLQDAAEKRLRKLVTGKDAEARRQPEDQRSASVFARALTKYFPVPSGGKGPLELEILEFGGSEEVSDRLATFAVARAIREARRAACPLCDDHLSMHTHEGRTGSWVGIARDRARIPTALPVFYFDLGDGRIPARYDAELPMPSADIAARLERGDGLVAVRERPGAPPAVLIAAPREAQLADVEEALAAMKTIPGEPVAIPLKSALKPHEIQAVVRGSFGAYRACYEAVLKSEPAVAGTTRMHFSIRGDGSVDALTFDTDAALRGDAFEACMAAATRALVFPATHAVGPTTVTYPIAFSPDP